MLWNSLLITATCRVDSPVVTIGQFHLKLLLAQYSLLLMQSVHGEHVFDVLLVGDEVPVIATSGLGLRVEAYIMLSLGSIWG